MGVLDDAIREHLALRRKHGATEDELSRTEAEALGPARREASSPPPRAEGGPTPEAEAGAGPEDRVEPIHDTGSPEEDALEEPFAEDEVPATELLQESDLHPPGANGRTSEAGAATQPAEADVTDEGASEVDAGEPGPSYEEGSPEESELLEDALAEDQALEEEEPSAPEEEGIERDLAPSEEPTAFPRDPLEAETIEHEPLEEEELDAEDLEDAEYGAETPEDEPGNATAPPPDPDEDVLEETPDFLRDTPEHERLWFEQKPPRDFDLDE